VYNFIPNIHGDLLMGEMSLLEQETMRVVLLDTRNRVLSIQEAYKGSLNTTMVRIAELFREAIRGNCAAIIVAHNHLSGDPSPPEDVAITKDIVEREGTIIQSQLGRQRRDADRISGRQHRTQSLPHCHACDETASVTIRAVDE
jgi:hypothetical protein